MRTNEYQYEGHAGNGGIQRHSLGDLFPWDVVAVGDLQPVEWQAVNHQTGQRGERRSCIRQAFADARGFAARAQLLQALAAAPLHTWPAVQEAIAAAGEQHAQATRRCAQEQLLAGPYTIIGIGDDHVVFDRRTGRIGNRWRTYREALIDLAGLRIRNLQHS